MRRFMTWLGSVPLVFLVACEAAAPADAGPSGPGGGELGKADGGDAQGLAEIRFAQGAADPVVTASLVAGRSVRVRYETGRMRDMVSWSNGRGDYLAEVAHCYGYGCCEVTFPEARAHYRFAPDAPFGEAALDADGSAALAIPREARRLELYFDAPSYTLRTWYCGCDEACARAAYDASTPTEAALQVWDSRYGANYVFDVTPPAAGPTVTFGADVAAPPTVSGPIVAGGEARVVFDRSRFFRIIDWMGQSPGNYWEYAHHCYGYGCCDVTFPTVAVHYRFRGGDGFAEAALDAQGGADLAIPASAERLELYFQVAGYDLRSWYCGCDAACEAAAIARATPRHVDFQAWDSRYAQNYVLPVSR